MKITPTPHTVIPMPPPDKPAEDQGPDRSHDWVVAATVSVSEKVAKHSFLRGSFVTSEGQRVEALEVYCSGCRRPWDDVADAECEAKIDNTHLIGGDAGVRKKRKTHEPQGQWMPAPPIERRGIEAVVRGYA